MKTLISILFSVIFLVTGGDKDKIFEKAKNTKYPVIIKNSSMTRSLWTNLPAVKNKDFWYAEVEYPFSTKITEYWNSKLRKQYNPDRKSFINAFMKKKNIVFATISGPTNFSVSYDIKIATKIDDYVILSESVYQENQFVIKKAAVLNSKELAELLSIYKKIQEKTIELYGTDKFIDKKKYDESLDRYSKMTRMSFSLQKTFSEAESYSGVFINNTNGSSYFHLAMDTHNDILVETDYSTLAEFQKQILNPFYNQLDWKITYTPKKQLRSKRKLTIEEQNKKIDQVLTTANSTPLAYLNKNTDKKNIRLQIAAYHNFTEASMEAINKGANINITGKYGDSPLLLACRNSNLKLVKFLILKGANVSLTNNSGSSPIIEAANRKDFEILQALVNAGADVNTRTEDDISPIISVLSSATKKEQTFKIVTFLLKKGANPKITPEFGMDALGLAVYNNDIKSVKLLINNGAKLNKVNDGLTPIMVAVSGGFYDIAEYLLANGANPNDRVDKQTLLMYAAQVNLKFVKLVVEKGAEINARDSYGATALLYAADYGHADIVEYLLTKNADVNIQENTTFGKGYTALMYAVEDSEVYKTQAQIVKIEKLLLAHKANKNLKNIDGKTAIDIATLKNIQPKYKKDIIEVLK